MIEPIKNHKPTTKREVAMHTAWRARRREAVRLNCAESDVLDRKAEEVWAKFVDPDYYASEFEMSAFKRRTEWPSNNHFKRERIHEDSAV